MLDKIFDPVVNYFNVKIFNPPYLSLTRDQYWEHGFDDSLYNKIEWHDGMKVLDLGCGIGYLAHKINSIAPCRISIVGIDLNEKNILFANKYRKGNMMFYQRDVFACLLPSESFDLVVCQSLFINIRHPDKLIKEMIRLTKKGGEVLIIEPLRTDMHYYPQFSFLEKTKIFHQNIANLFFGFLGVDRNVALKIPQMFLASGAEKVTLDSFSNLMFLPQNIDHDKYINEMKSHVGNISVNESGPLKKMLGHIQMKIWGEQKRWLTAIIKDRSLLSRTGEVRINPLLLVKVTLGKETGRK